MGFCNLFIVLILEISLKRETHKVAEPLFSLIDSLNGFGNLSIVLISVKSKAKQVAEPLINLE